MKKLLLVFMTLGQFGCQGYSPCEVKVENFGKYLVVQVTNTSKKSVELDAEGRKILLAVKKKMGSWTYDLNNLTRKTGVIKLVPGEKKVERKFISKYEKKYKYKLELVCNGDKQETKEF